jgi:hypothetical protein
MIGTNIWIEIGEDDCAIIKKIAEQLGQTLSWRFSRIPSTTLEMHMYPSGVSKTALTWFYVSKIRLDWKEGEK